MNGNQNEKIDIILEKLEKLEEKIDENNEFLNAEKNSKRWSKIIWILKWIIIISLGIVTWAHLEPIYKDLVEVYKNISETVDKTENSLSELKKTLDKIPKAEDFSFQKLKEKISK